MLFKVQAGVLLGINQPEACTSQLCAWKRARKRATPQTLKKMNFKRPKKCQLHPTIRSPQKSPLKGFSSSDPAKHSTEFNLKKITELKKIAPKAALFKSISLWDSEESDGSLTESGDENENNILPEPLTFLYNPSLINEPAVEKFESCFDQYLNSCNEKQFKNLVETTITQHENNIWKQHRLGRITASIAKSAFVTNIKNPSKSFIDTVMGYKSNVDVPATRYGSNMEDLARRCYINMTKTHHINLRVNKTGLHINVQWPYLGASPDGIISCDCHGTGLLEIKCPFKYQDGLEMWYNDSNFLVANGIINKKHPYYFQMQHQMMITEKTYCDFFVWSKGKKLTDKFLIRINANNNLHKEMKLKFQTLFYKIILPELVTRKNDPNIENPEQQYCMCKRPSFPPIVACDMPGCSIEWYHYCCVGLKKSPKNKWICPSCKEAK